MNLQRHIHVKLRGGRVVRRRDFLKVAGLAAGGLGWHDLVSVRAKELQRSGRACVLLWMQGGPSQFETFSPKPNHANGGETKAIATSVPGIEIAENLPRLASKMDDLAVIRSMTSREGSHPRATSLLHTGYLPTASVKYPTLGALVAHQKQDVECQLPSFVRVGAVRGGEGGGFLGVDYNPFVVARAGQPPANTQPTTSRERYRRRLGLLQRLEADYAGEGAGQIVEEHRKLYDKSARMILSPQMNAFRLDDEPAAARNAYGSSNFATGCLLARRLVASGVSFVEVVSNGWDTHQDNFSRTRQRTNEIDRPFAQLLADLKDRGLLDTTLVIWMGEFGRTPRVNPRGGRDHYPRAFNVALAGAGIRGGRVIGSTDPGGSTVADRPVSVSDLFQTFCKSLAIRPGPREHEHHRPADPDRRRRSARRGAVRLSNDTTGLLALPTGQSMPPPSVRWASLCARKAAPAHVSRETSSATGAHVSRETCPAACRACFT